MWINYPLSDNNNREIASHLWSYCAIGDDDIYNSDNFQTYFAWKISRIRPCNILWDFFPIVLFAPSPSDQSKSSHEFIQRKLIFVSKYLHSPIFWDSLIISSAQYSLRCLAYSLVSAMPLPYLRERNWIFAFALAYLYFFQNILHRFLCRCRWSGQAGRSHIYAEGIWCNFLPQCKFAIAQPL